MQFVHVAYYLATRIYIKVTSYKKTADSELTEIVCRRANYCRKVFLQVNF
jgi:hypothetical protein